MGIIFLITIPLPAQTDSLNYKRNTLIDSIEDEMTVPLYENNIKDYRISQPIKYGVKLASYGVVPYLLYKMDSRGENVDMVDGIIVAGSVIGTISLGVIGGAYGYWHGKNLIKVKESDPGFYTGVCYFGHEFSYDNTYIASGKSYDLKSTPKYSFVFQNYTEKLIIPSEYRIGFTIKEWFDSEDGYWSSDDRFVEKRINFDILFNSNKDYFQLHYGLGSGYSWGTHETVIDSENNETENTYGLFFYPILGITINANDFFYLRVEGKYEYSEFYNEMTDFFGDTENGNFNIGFSFGTYIF
jgi:hypothetical protein